MSKSISDDIRGSDGSMYTKEASYNEAHSFLIVKFNEMMLRRVGVLRRWSSRTSMVVHA